MTEVEALLVEAGFDAVELEAISLEFPLQSPGELVAALLEGTVRTAALPRAADGAQARLIQESPAARLEPRRRGDVYAVPAPVRIASGRKPG